MSPTTNTNTIAGWISQFNSGITGLNNILDELKENSDNEQLIEKINTFRDQNLDNNQSLLNSLRTLNTSMLQVDANHQFAGLIGRDTVNAINRQNNMFNQEIANKRRMTEINNYYSNMNTQINFIMRNLVIILAIIIIITVLAKKGIVPKDISNFTTGIGVLVIIIYVIYNVYDLNIRDRFNFVQYKIPFSEEARKQGLSGTRLNSLTDNLRNRFTNFMSSSCVGEDCCETGTIYDTNRDRCMPVLDKVNLSPSERTQVQNLIATFNSASK